MAEDYLARILEGAAGDPSLRAEFRKALLAATVFVMGEIEGEDPARRPQATLNAGSRVTLRSQLLGDGRTVVPFFSSLEKLRGFIKGNDQVNYLAIPARTLFDIAKGSILALNPGDRVRGEFTSEDIEKIIALEAPAGSRKQ